MKRKLKVNDFFCGCGGMGIAFKNAGYEIAGAWDFDKYAVESYRANVGDHVQKADIKELHQADIPQADVWAFGFPCQDLSVAGKQRGMILKCEDCGEEIEINPEEYTGNTICPKCSSNNFKAASRSGCFFEMMRLLEETEREREHAMTAVIISGNVRGLRPYAFYQIVQSDDELDSITKKRRSDIYIKAFNTSVKKIAFNSKKSDGFNPQLVVNDEMEAWPGDQGLKQYEVMTSALGARKQPLIISIATAGYVNDGIFDELFKRATAFLKGNSREKRLLPFIYMIDDIEKWDSIEELKKSNPNLGVSVSAEYYLEQIEIARNSISKKVEFMTKFCNIKQNSAVAWLDYWDVMKCVHEEKPLSLEDFKGCYCVGGIDLSRTTDLTAASIVINRDGINHIFTRFYMPQKRYEVAINEDNTPYNIYRDRGFLFISGENQVDYKDVYNWFIELVKVYKIKPLKIGYDRYSANYLVEDLKTAGFHTDDVYQGTNLTPILHEFEGNLKDGLFDFGDNSMLAAHFLNVAVDINLNDSRMKPVKIEKRMRIDGAMSVFDALTMVSKYHNEIGKKLLNISKETA